MLVTLVRYSIEIEEFVLLFGDTKESMRCSVSVRVVHVIM